MIKTKKSDTERINKLLAFHVPIHVHTAVKKLAAAEKRSMASMLYFIVSSYLESRGLTGGENK